MNQIAEPSTALPRAQEPQTTGGTAQFLRAELWLTVAGFVVRAWVVAFGYFRLDDWINVDDARRLGLTPEYLFQNWFGHLEPLRLGLVWLATTLAPANYYVAILPVLLILGITMLLMLKLLRTLVDAGWVRLFAVAVFAFSPLMLRAAHWWTAALEYLPLQMCLVGAMLGVAKFVQGSAKWALAPVGFFVLGLAFWEKSLIIAPLVLGMLWVMRLRGDLTPASFRKAVTRYGGVFAVLGGLYLFVYGRLIDTPRTSWQGLDVFVDGWVQGIFAGLLPMVVGGPWKDPSVGLSLVEEPSAWSIVLGLVVSILLIAASITMNGFRAAAAWLVVAGYLCLDILPVLLTRLHYIGPILLRDTRYIVDSLPVLVVFSALAFSPFRGEVLMQRWHLPAWMRQPTVPAIVLGLYVASSLVTTWGMGRATHDSPARDFVRNSRTDVEQLRDPVIFDEGAPGEILSPLLPDYSMISLLFRAEGLPGRFDQPTDTLYKVTSEGNVVPAEVGRAADSFIGPVPGCGWLVRGEAVTIPMANDLYDWNWGVRIRYLAQESMNGTVSMGEEDYAVLFRKGLNEVFLVHRGKPTPVRIVTDDPKATLCVDQVRIGDVHPKDDNPDNG